MGRERERKGGRNIHNFLFKKRRERNKENKQNENLTAHPTLGQLLAGVTSQLAVSGLSQSYGKSGKYADLNKRF